MFLKKILEIILFICYTNFVKFNTLIDYLVCDQIKSFYTFCGLLCGSTFKTAFDIIQAILRTLLFAPNSLKNCSDWSFPSQRLITYFYAKCHGSPPPQYANSTNGQTAKQPAEINIIIVQSKHEITGKYNFITVNTPCRWQTLLDQTSCVPLRYTGGLSYNI